MPYFPWRILWQICQTSGRQSASLSTSEVGFVDVLISIVFINGIPALYLQTEFQVQFLEPTYPTHKSQDKGISGIGGEKRMHLLRQMSTEDLEQN